MTYNMIGFPATARVRSWSPSLQPTNYLVAETPAPGSKLSHLLDTTDNIEASAPLYYASHFGLLSIVKMILSSDEVYDRELPGGV